MDKDGISFSDAINTLKLNRDRALERWQVPVPCHPSPLPPFSSDFFSINILFNQENLQKCHFLS